MLRPIPNSSIFRLYQRRHGRINHGLWDVWECDLVGQYHKRMREFVAYMRERLPEMRAEIAQLQDRRTKKRRGR